MKINHNTLGLKIKRFRKAIRMKQAELAKMVSIPPSVLSLIEHDWKKPTPEQMQRLEEVIEFEKYTVDENDY